MVSAARLNVLTLVLFAVRTDKTESTLKCKVCASGESAIYIDFHDSRRISYDIQKPFCRDHEEVTCTEDQDACITVVQPSGPDSYTYLITKGCSYKRKYPVLGCTRKKETVQGIQFESGSGRHGRKVSVNVLTQDTCVCDWANCNGSKPKIFYSRYLTAVCLTISLFRFLLERR